MKPMNFIPTIGKRLLLWLLPLFPSLLVQASVPIAEPPPIKPIVVIASTTERLKAIARFVLVEGTLWAEVYSHSIDSVEGPIPCWTYATVGMQSVNQKEMLLTVKREKGEAEDAFDRFLPNLFTSFYKFAQKGQVVDIGGITQLGPGGTPILGRPDFLGLIYTAPQSLPGLEVRPDQLTVLLVTQRELSLGLRLGMTRLLSRLGESVRYYPVPPWADRRRHEVFGPDSEETKSMLARVPGFDVPGMRVRIEDEDAASKDSEKVLPAPPGSLMKVNLPTGRVVLTVTSKAAPGLKKALSALNGQEVLCLHTELDPEADSCLVWKAGSTIPMAISKPGATGRHVTGNYLLLVGSQTTNAMKGVEDGFSFLLTSKDWERIREALSSGQALTLPGNDAMPALVIKGPTS